MKQSGVRRFFLALVFAAAIGAVWYGADRFVRQNMTGEDTDLTDEAHDTSGPEYESPKRQEWTPPEVMPDASDWHGRIKVGDFGMLAEEDRDYLPALERTFSAIRTDSDYAEFDLNGDGTDELLWMHARTDADAAYVIGIFSRQDTGERVVFWEPAVEEDACYIMGDKSLLFIRNNDWVVSEYHCTEVLFDHAFEMYAGEGLTMYLAEDAGAFRTEVDAALRRRLSFIEDSGVWYFAVGTGEQVNDAQQIGADAWMASFREMTGRTFAQIAPSFETLRSGIETGVSRQVFVAKRAGYEELPYETIVTYPQLMEGTFAAVINQILKNEAFALLSHVDADTENPEAVLSGLIDDLRITTTEEVRYRVLHDGDDLLSILYRVRRQDMGEDTGTGLYFLTVDKTSGRKIQIGDITSTEQVMEAAANEEAEVFSLDENLRRIYDDTHDAAWVADALEKARTGSERFKSIGLDEQYLYLAVQSEEASDTDILVRIPRWKAGMSTPGHMELLTMHRAYPFLKEVLDDADSLTVRKHADGFEISYLTADSGRVRAKLQRSTQKLPLFDTPEAARDHYMSLYADVTGFSTGRFAENRPDGSAYEADFYAVETYYGESGRAFLSLQDESYELVQRCNSTRGGFLLRTDDETYLQTKGHYRAVYGGSAFWYNYGDDSLSVVRQVTPERSFSFRFLPDPEKKTQTLLEIAPADAPWQSQQLTLTGEMPDFAFRDADGDGHDDLFVTEGEAQRLFLYRVAKEQYEEAPRELTEAQDFRYDTGTGYLIITRERTEDHLYQTAHEAGNEGIVLRSLEQKKTAAGYSLIVKEHGVTDGEEESTVLFNITATEETIAEDFRVADALLRMRIVWQDVFEREKDVPQDANDAADTETTAEENAAQEEEAEAETERIRIIAGQVYVTDLFTPYYRNTLYVLQGEGASRYLYHMPVQDRLTEVRRIATQEGEALQLIFETEAPVTVGLRELYEALP